MRNIGGASLEPKEAPSKFQRSLKRVSSKEYHLQKISSNGTLIVSRAKMPEHAARCLIRRIPHTRS